jgi:hypothetical protein
MFPMKSISSTDGLAILSTLQAGKIPLEVSLSNASCRVASSCASVASVSSDAVAFSLPGGVMEVRWPTSASGEEMDVSQVVGIGYASFMRMDLGDGLTLLISKKTA